MHVAGLKALIAVTVIVSVAMAASPGGAVAGKGRVTFKQESFLGVRDSIIDICFHGLKDETKVTFTVVNRFQRPPSTKRHTTRRVFRFQVIDLFTFITPVYWLDSKGGMEGPGANECSDVTLGLRNNFRNYRGFLDLRMTSTGRLLGKATYRYTITFEPGHLIWEGTDAFINVCIGDAKPIRSTGGRLYCVSDSVGKETLQRVWR